MKRTIYFDMDGTIANLYAHPQWLELLRAYDPEPYGTAAVMLNMSLLARYLNKIQAEGYRLGIVSWLSKQSTPEYDAAVTEAKTSWLSLHLRSVSWNVIHIVPYGTPKESFMETDEDILFDDEERNRNNWEGEAHTPDEIFEVLKALLAD